MSEIENTTNVSDNTSNFIYESLLQDIIYLSNNNIFIIPKAIEQKIPDILSFLHDNSNLAIYKIMVVDYLRTLFLKISINSEIFLRNYSSDQDKLNLFQIIIQQYITYTNSLNSIDDENNYRNQLLELFDILLVQVTFGRESYHYILSFILTYINEKNNTLKKKENQEDSNEDEFHLTAEHLKRILSLLYRFYQFIDENRLSSNYFFFSGESDSAITIRNKNSIKDDKKILSVDDNICILLFIKVFPSVYVKMLYSKSLFNILELKLNDTEKDKNIFLNMDSDYNLTTNFSTDIIGQLSESETNWLLIKYKRKKAKVKIYHNGNKIYSRKHREKDKEEIKQIILFNNFIGICYNFIIYRIKKKKEILPKFLENEMKKNIVETHDNNSKKIPLPYKSLYYNGFINEELLFPFIKYELKDELYPEALNELFNSNDNDIDSNHTNNSNSINNSDIKDFIEKIIAIYMPSRTVVPSFYYKNTLMNTPQFIIEDSINGLDAVFFTKSPSLNGVHLYKRIVNNFSSIGGLNNLLPIMELMAGQSELLTKINFESFFDILIYILTPQYQKALEKENNNNFFLYLSFFLEKIPDQFFDKVLTARLKYISSFLMNQINHNKAFCPFFQQFINYILMSEKLFFKFNYEEQKEIIEIINQSFTTIDPDKKPLVIDMNKIIKILLNLDENKNKLFCCKKHSEYFLEKYEIMAPELSIRLSPFEELLKNVFKEFKRKIDCLIEESKNNDIKEMGNNLYKIFELLTYDVSPCIQKMIIGLFSCFLDNNFNEYLSYIDQEQQLLNIFLFIFKTSIFEIKKEIFDYIIMILKNEKKPDKDIQLKYIFITNNILPFFLFEDNELLKLTIKQEEEDCLLKKGSSLQNVCSEVITYNDNFEHLTPNELDDLRYSMKVNNMNVIDNYLDENNNDLMNEIYGEDNLSNKIKTDTIINGLNHSLPKLDKNMALIYSIYDKTKLKVLIKDLYEIACKYFDEGSMLKLCLSLLAKIVSKGDISLILYFLSYLDKKVKSEGTQAQIDEIYDNQDLFQWLIETYFQVKLIKRSNLDKTIFVPGFNLHIENFNEKTKEDSIKYIIDKCKELLLNIFDRNIYKMDYILTLSKYYYELRNETNNFSIISKKTFKFMYNILPKIFSNFSNPDIMNDLKLKKMIYFFNLLFEFVTFYKLKPKDLESHVKDGSIYQELSNNLKHILISKKDNGRDASVGHDIEETLDSKFKEYYLFKTAFDNWTPLWYSTNWETDDLYKNYISKQKNININELELLFYDFSDIDEFKDENKGKKIYVNKGVPLIYIIYHFFILIFSIGGTETELRLLFNDFRFFIILLIVSSSSLSASSGKKKKWPSDEQYNNVQKTTEAILFNFLYFLFKKVKGINEKIAYFNDLEQKEQKLDDNDNKYLNYLYKIYKLLIENIGYILKTLNKIYREIKKEELKKKKGVGRAVGNFLKNLFVEYEGVKKSGGFKIMEKIYSECPSLSSNDTNYLDLITEVDFTKKDLLINSKSADSNKDKEKTESFLKLENYVLSYIQDSQIENFFLKHTKEYEKILFPFLSYISSRRDAMKQIIPFYDNRPNLASYSRELCLVPDYLPYDLFDINILSLNIKASNESIFRYLKINEIKSQIEEQTISHNYKKEKEKLFSFTRIWSVKKYFYNKKKYRLKYRLLNHLSDDYTRVLLTPIIDVDYYLPQFSKFDPSNIFRNNLEYNPICKVADFSFDLQTEKKPEINEKKDNKQNQIIDSKKTAETPGEIPSGEKEENNNEENNDEENDKNALYYIGKEYFTFSKKGINENFYNNIFKEFIKIKHNSDIIIDSCLVRLAFHIRGKIFNNQEGIGFYSFESKRHGTEEDYDSDRKMCFGSVFSSQNMKYTNYFIFIPYNKIQFVLKRRYFFKKTALEIFTENRKSYLFRIDEKIDIFFEQIKNDIKEIEDICIEYNKFDEKIGFFNKNNIFLNTNMRILTNKKKYMNLNILYEKWKNWEISTLKMIMIMNLYANRSYNDINQYPVFPWIITDYTSKTFEPFTTDNYIRPMNKPMGMMDFTEESKERKENYEEHWRSSEADEDRVDNYDRYGSHYSTSLYLTYYLVRVFPYSYIRIELQGKSFDDPNRLFNSLPNSFDCALTQKSDLRELIPEFFCFPEMFSNMNELNLGEIDVKGTPKLVEGVEMPAWADYNEYNFIAKHRLLLESLEINEKINEWFNLIFGSKQKGKEAKKIGNLFIKQTYEDFEETYLKSSKKDQIYQCRMVEFGVTPNQLFKYDAHKRNYLRDCGKIKRTLLYRILKHRHKKKENSGKELDLQEIKINIEENISKMFIFVVKKKEKKKERIYLLTNNKVKIYTKKDKNQLFTSKMKGKEKDKSKSHKEDIKIEKDNETFQNDSLEIRDECDETENDILLTLSSSCTFYDNTRENEMRMLGKEQSKISVYPKYDKKYYLPKYRMSFNKSPTILYDEGYCIAFGGFWNGDIILRQLIEDDKKKNKSIKINIIKTWELSPITKIIIDKTETFAICCNSEGTVFIFIIDQNDKLFWNLHKTINEGQGEISSVALNENLNIFIICFKNGFCMVYTLPNCKLFNSFRIEENDLNSNTNIYKDNSDMNKENIISIPSSNKIYSPDITIISQSPLPSFIFHIKERKSLCIYSINSHFQKEFYLGYEIVENGIKKYTDFFSRDYLFIYNIYKNAIDIHSLVDLDLIATSPFIDDQFVDFQFTKGQYYLFILVKVKQGEEEKSPLYKMLLLKKAPHDSSKIHHF